MLRNRTWILLIVLAATAAPSLTNAQVTRIEERDPSISYLQDRWYETPDPRWSDGEAIGAFEAGSTMTVNFSGTGITWIGYRCACAAGTARLYIDGQFLGNVNTYAATPEPQAEIYSVDGLANGAHTFTIEATGTYHASGTSAYIIVDAFDIEGSGGSGSSDTVPPQVTITSPSDGASATGPLTVTADASDNVWVQNVRVLVNGEQQGAVDTAAPYAIGIDTSTLADGTHELTVIATDWAGNTAEDSVNVQVGNSGYIEEYDPSITYTGEWIDLNDPAVSGGTVVGSFQRGATATVSFNGTGITWIGFRCACAAGIARVYVDGNLAATVDTYAAERTARAEIFSTSGLTAGEHVVRIEHTGNYHNQGTSAYLIIDAFRVANGGGSSGGGGDDTTAPSVSAIQPTGTVSGTVTVTVNVTDDTGVEAVQFLLDGEPLGAEDTSAPFSLSWDTTTAFEGGHVLSARARDAAGNVGQMLYPPTLFVDNAPPGETTPPTVSIDDPPFGTTVTGGSVTFTASAADNVGVARVGFYIDGLLIGQDTSAPYTTTWSTQSLQDFGYVLRATAFDADGNATGTMAHLINVWNSAAPPPTVTITSPADGATVSGTVTLAAEATHPNGIERVTFSVQPLNGSGISGGGGAAFTAPYSRTWDTTAIPDGTYRIWATVEGNGEAPTYYSHLVNVTVDN